MKAIIQNQNPDGVRLDIEEIILETYQDAVDILKAIDKIQFRK